MSIVNNDRNQNINHSLEQSGPTDKHLISTKTAYREQNFLEIHFEPKTILKIISLTIFALVVISTLGQVYSYVLAEGIQGNIVTLFYIDEEANIPTTFASFSLLLCSGLLAIIAKDKYGEVNRYRRHWKFLSLIFLYLAVDEAAEIHEMSMDITSKLLNTSGFFYFAWVVPAIILFSIFTLIYFKFVFSLPNDTRFLFILAAMIFVCGALGIEMIGGQFVTFKGQTNLLYAMIATIEETLEMIGIAIFIYALLKYIQNYIKPLKIGV